MAVLPPYHQRLIRINVPPHQTEYQAAINSPSNSRWYPLFTLLSERFRGGKSYSDYEVGRLLRLKDEYDNGVERKG